MVRRSVSLLASISLALAACSSSSSPDSAAGVGGAGQGASGAAGAGLGGAASGGSSGSAGSAGSGGSGGLAGGPGTYSFSYTTMPGEETHWCQYVKMPRSDGGEVIVTGWKWSEEYLHHWALYQTTPDLPADVDMTQPFDCFQPGAMKYAQPGALALAPNASGDQNFPAGAGFSFKSEEVVIVQAHTLNVTTDVVHPTLGLEFHLGDASQIQNRLGLIQFYDPYIYVPMQGASTAQMRCQIPQDITVVFGGTHEHIRGVGVNVFLDGPDGTPGAQPIASGKNWDDPPTSAAAVSMAKGSFVRTVCSYQGDGKREVVQGQDKIDNEMCMYIGYYYPIVADPQQRALFENCVQTPVPQGVGDMYGTGAASCADSLTCLKGCPAGEGPKFGNGRIDVGKCYQQCVVGSSPTATAALNAATYCIGTKCAAACGGPNAATACAGCVVSNCAAEYGACQSAK